MTGDKYNAFISYAWADNELPVEGSSGWVSAFLSRLRGQLGRELRRQSEGDRVFIDYERLRRNQPLSDAIRGVLSDSLLLVPIVSPSYFASLWCRQELEAFFALHGPQTDRIFPVWMEPVDPDELPAEARPLAAAVDERLKYQFWYLDEERQVRTRHFPQVDPTDREFGLMQQKMAREMASLLREIQKTEQPEEELPQALLPVVESDQLILVNGGDADADQVMRVAERLWEDHHVGTVVPLVAQRDRSAFKPSELTKDLRDNLDLCTGVLMVYCSGPQVHVYQQLKEYQRAAAKLRKSNKEPPALILCHRPPAPLTFRAPGMQVLTVNGDCAGDCLHALIAELAK